MSCHKICDEIEILVNFLHLGAIIVLKRWEVIIIALLRGSIVVINAKTKLDHAVNAASEGGWLIQGEARGEEGSVEEEPDEILDRFVVFVFLCASAESVHDRVHGVD